MPNRNKLLLLLIFCLAVFSVFARGQEQNGSPQAINWILALDETRSGDSIPLSAPVRSKSGERFQLYIVPKAECFAYVIVESSNGEIVVIYSERMERDKPWYSPELEISPPQGTEYICS